MKVLYVGNMKDGTGYGNAAIEYIKALKAADVDVVARRIRFNDADLDPGEVVKECEQNTLDNVTHVIYHTLPHNFEYDGRFKNVGLFYWETSDYTHSSWPEFVNMMDCIICPNDVTYRATQDHNKRCYQVKTPIDVNKFDGIKPLDISLLKNHCNFYFIGENVRRKNLHGLLKAFHTEFGPDEPVNLVIKTSMSGMSPEQALNYTKQMCMETQANLKIYKTPKDYKKEVIITDRLTDEQMLGLHLACDCFVMPSYGEGYCLPLYDAILAGKMFLCTRNAGMIDDSWGSINSQQEVVFGNTQTFMDLYTGTETWSTPSSVELARKMRQVYNGNYKPLTDRCRLMNTCNYKDIGNRLADVLSKL
jgi:glycosyltransferase involved in cell wall biosynthesis